MHKYTVVTALVIALSITMLTPAVSAHSGWWPPAANQRTGNHEADCDRQPVADWGRKVVISCHCEFECKRQYSYTVTLPCSSNDVAIWSSTRALQRQHEGLCDVRMVPVDTTAACIRTCVKAKKGTYP
jgi:hypothetical protein